eukprot:1344450-Pyramimonas_sp.AAC.1
MSVCGFWSAGPASLTRVRGLGGAGPMLLGKDSWPTLRGRLERERTLIGWFFGRLADWRAGERPSRNFGARRNFDEGLAIRNFAEEKLMPQTEIQAINRRDAANIRVFGWHTRSSGKPKGAALPCLLVATHGLISSADCAT